MLSVDFSAVKKVALIDANQQRVTDFRPMTTDDVAFTPDDMPPGKHAAAWAYYNSDGTLLSWAALGIFGPGDTVVIPHWSKLAVSVSIT